MKSDVWSKNGLFPKLGRFQWCTPAATQHHYRQRAVRNSECDKSFFEIKPEIYLCKQTSSILYKQKTIYVLNGPKITAYKRPKTTNTTLDPVNCQGTDTVSEKSDVPLFDTGPGSAPGIGKRRET